jgi:CBS domain containing-hemolysin-like protein
MQLASMGAAFALVIANAFFVAMEFALVKVRPSQLEALAAEDRSGAKLALMMRKNLNT